MTVTKLKALPPRPVPADQLLIAGSGAEFRTMREGLGLTVEDAAEMLGVKTRSLIAWERNGPPLAAARKLRRMHDEVEQFVEAALDNYSLRRLEAGKPIPTRLIRYGSFVRYASSEAAEMGLPYPLHCAFLTRLYSALLRLGAQATVVWDAEAER